MPLSILGTSCLEFPFNFSLLNKMNDIITDGEISSSFQEGCLLNLSFSSFKSFIFIFLMINV